MIFALSSYAIKKLYSNPINTLIGLRARFWRKLDDQLLDNYLTFCMFTKSSIEGIDMFTFCRIYTSNCLPIEIKKYDMYCRKKWEKKTWKKWYIGKRNPFDSNLCFLKLVHSSSQCTTMKYWENEKVFRKKFFFCILNFFLW